MVELIYTVSPAYLCSSPGIECYVMRLPCACVGVAGRHWIAHSVKGLVRRALGLRTMPAALKSCLDLFLLSAVVKQVRGSSVPVHNVQSLHAARVL